MRQHGDNTLQGFCRATAGAVALDWIAMGTVVLILGIATAGSLGDDVAMVQSSMESVLGSLPGGDKPEE